MPHKIPTLLMSFGLFVSTACGGGGAAYDAGAGAGDVGAAAASVASMTEPMELSEKDIEQFLTVLEELKSLGERYGDDGDLNNVGAAIMANHTAHAIVRKHGFADLIQFQRVAYNIQAAMAANAMAETGGDMAPDRKQLETMKAQLPKEQYDMLVKAQEQMSSMVAGQPAGNRELVARYADRIETAGSN
jgi:hypothetical protein